MIEEIKKKIDANKKDTKVFKEYIKSFVESEKAQELFSEDESFNSLKQDKKVVKKEEDKFF